jgi:hypothetical protein
MQPADVVGIGRAALGGTEVTTSCSGGRYTSLQGNRNGGGLGALPLETCQSSLSDSGDP